MSHFAQIDDNNIVVQVLVIDQAEIDTGNWGDPAKWIQTSYNTRGGVYYTPNTNTLDPDQSKAFRKNFAGVGMVWLPDGPQGGGFAGLQPYPSWTLNPFSYQWEPPFPPPDGRQDCSWDEAAQNWVCPDTPAEIPVYPD